MLRTERLLLRRPTAADLASPPAFLTDPEVMRFLGGVDAPLAVVQRWLDDWERFPVGKLLLDLDGTVIGRAGFNFYEPVAWRRSTAPDAVPELGWALDRAHWGKGYATEAALAIRGWGGFDRVISLIAPDNLRSQRVAERLGAVPTESVTLLDSSEAVVWLHPD